MRQITKLTDDANQQIVMVGDIGIPVELELLYMPTQQLWSLSLVAGDFVLNGITLVMAPNLLRQYKNIINFGLAVVSDDGVDPYYLNDFTKGRVKLYLLNAQDVQRVEERYYNGLGY